MDLNCLKTKWLQEERIAHIHGWDFSHIEGRFEEGHDIPWNYGGICRRSPGCWISIQVAGNFC